MRKYWEALKQDVRNFFSYVGDVLSGTTAIKDQKLKNDIDLFVISEFGDKTASYQYNMEQLLSMGVSQKGLNKALMMASISNQPKTAQKLIENGADPKTVLHSFTRFDDISAAVSKVLREYDEEDVAKTVEENQKKILETKQKFNKPARKTLFELQYESMGIHEKGQAMATAIAQGNWASMQIVLMHSDFSKNTAWYDSAIAFGSEHMAENEGNRDLYRNQVLGLFISKGADVNTMDGYCLRLAARSADFETVDFLLKKGADPMVKNGEVLSFTLVHGQTAFFERMAPTGEAEFTKEKEVQLLGTALLSQNWETVAYLCERFKQLPMSQEQVEDCFGFVCANGKQIFQRMEQSKGQETVFSMYIDYKQQQAAAQKQAVQSQPANENATTAVAEPKAKPAVADNNAAVKKPKITGLKK